MKTKNIFTLILTFIIIISLTGIDLYPAKSKKIRKRRRRTFVIGDNIMPKHKSGIKLPKKFLRGIYLHCITGRSVRRMRTLIKQAKKAHINAMVIDVAPYKSMRPVINPKTVKMLIDAGIYPIARIVAFQYGLKTKHISKKHMNAIFRLVDLSVKAGFKEIQLDYIRFADGWRGASLKWKYNFIAELLHKVKKRINNANIPLATDVFGRIVYNRGDVIGQQLESMAKYADVICPMVYPSHYYPDYYKLRHPYFTVRQSTIKGLNRVGSHTFIMPYIQAFKMNVRYTKLSLGGYILAQVRAVEDTAARGYIIWNARNRYGLTFKVLRDYYKKHPEKLNTNSPSGYKPNNGNINPISMNKSPVDGK